VSSFFSFFFSLLVVDKIWTALNKGDTLLPDEGLLYSDAHKAWLALPGPTVGFTPQLSPVRSQHVALVLTHLLKRKAALLA